MAIKVLLDADPGIDDSIALLLALFASELEVVGITTVADNVPVDLAAQNALRVVELYWSLFGGTGNTGKNLCCC
jgi:inosine-uridine nucleoside N-ribohydrolase